MTSKLFLSAIGIGLTGCVYSFRSGALPSQVRTVNVTPFTNEATLVVPTLVQTLTEAVRQKFITQSSLVLSSGKADLTLYGRIIDFKVAPVAIQGTQQAAQNRLSITVEVRCMSEVFPELSWEQTFMNFSDFSAAQPLSQVQEALISDISDRIAQDIVNKTLSNW